MTTETLSFRLVLEPENPQRLANLCGLLNEHLRQIEERLKVKIRQRSNVFVLSGSENAVKSASNLLQQLYKLTETETVLSPDMVHLAIQENLDTSWIDEQHAAEAMEAELETEPVAQQKQENNQEQHELKDQDRKDYQVQIIRTPKISIKPRSRHQNYYVNSVMRHDINFGIGPAGTGKTYLAVACAVEALISERVERILLVRPAVEAGEKLGFLPGDLSQKVDPYLRPLYDSLYEMLGFERVAKLIDRNVIEVAPLAYMRGRTLNNSFVILDESQNTTASQMKMFLTRIGFGSTAVITGDITQIDLPRGTRSGLVHVSKILEDVEGISFTWFNSGDVVRHPIVQRVVEAYDRYDRQQTLTSLKHQEPRHHQDRAPE